MIQGRKKASHRDNHAFVTFKKVFTVLQVPHVISPLCGSSFAKRFTRPIPEIFISYRLSHHLIISLSVIIRDLFSRKEDSSKKKKKIDKGQRNFS